MRNLRIFSESQRRILHVLTGFSCNNNCVFCFEDDRPGRRDYVLSQRDEHIRAMISANAGAGEVLFTCGEPTLNPKLPEYIAWAREVGIETIGIISNGRRFAYPRYAERIVGLGVNSITLSIHGHNSRLHDSLTRTKGAFGQTVKGLENLSRLKTRRSIRLCTSTVLNKRNLGHLQALYGFLDSFPVDKIILNMIMPEGRGERYFSKLVPTFSQVAQEVEHLTRALSTDSMNRITLTDFPYCVGNGLPAVILGHLEQFVQYERAGCSGHKHIGREAFPSGIESAVSGYYPTSRQAKDKFFRVKREHCRTCRFDEVCLGIWRIYIDHFGWDEFAPQERSWGALRTSLEA